MRSAVVCKRCLSGHRERLAPLDPAAITTTLHGFRPEEQRPIAPVLLESRDYRLHVILALAFDPRFTVIAWPEPVRQRAPSRAPQRLFCRSRTAAACLMR